MDFPRLSLRTVFLWVFFVAFGLTIGSATPRDQNDFIAGSVLQRHNLQAQKALLATVSLAMLWSLAQEIGSLRRLRLADTASKLRTNALTVAIVWRSWLLALFAICLLTLLLVQRQLISLPTTEEYGLSEAVFPNYVWYFCIIVMLGYGVSRWSPGEQSPPESPWRTCISWIAATLLAAVMLTDVAFVHFLVHIATAGIEGHIPLQWQRLEAFPNHRLEGFRSFWLSAAAAASLLLSTAVLVYLLRSTNARRLPLIATFVGLLGACGVYSGWYWGQEFVRISPDFATVATTGNWIDLCGGATLGIAVCFVAAYRVSVVNKKCVDLSEKQLKTWQQTRTYEHVFCLCLLAMSIVWYAVQMLRVSYYAPGSLYGGFFLADLLANLWGGVNGYFYLLIGVLGIQLSWLRWRNRSREPKVEFRPINWDKFALAMLGFLSLAIVGLPTLAAFCFNNWLGPWYMLPMPWD